MFEKKTNIEEKTTLRRQPAGCNRKTTPGKDTTVSDLSLIQGDPVETEINNSENDRLNVKFSDLEKQRRQLLVDFDLLTNFEMHELPSDGDTEVQKSCTTSVQLRMPQKSETKKLRLLSQPTSPTHEQLSCENQGIWSHRTTDEKGGDIITVQQHRAVYHQW